MYKLRKMSKLETLDLIGLLVPELLPEDFLHDYEEIRLLVMQVAEATDRGALESQLQAAESHLRFLRAERKPLLREQQQMVDELDCGRPDLWIDGASPRRQAKQEHRQHGSVHTPAYHGSARERACSEREAGLFEELLQLLRPTNLARHPIGR